MTFQPFLIAPYRVGLELDIEPWLMPEDGFEKIENAHIHHGVVVKRNGYRLLAETAETDANYAISAITQADPGVVTIASTTAAGSAANITNGTRVQINYVVGMTEVNGVEFLAANVTGTTFDLTDLNGNNVDTSLFSAYTMDGYVSVFPEERIMGIQRCFDSNGVRQTYVWDKSRGYFFNQTLQTLSPLDLTDIFDSGNTDYIKVATWDSVASTAATPLNRIYFTNGKAVNGNLNGIRFYSCGATPTAPQTAAASLFQPTINGGNTLDAAKFIFAFRQRLLVLSTVEGATPYPQRMRWCEARKPGTPGGFTTEWDDNAPGLGGFVDAPTGEQIVSAEQLSNFIIVWFTNSIWTIEPTADPRLPFVWRLVTNFRGSDGRCASTQYDRYGMSVSNRGITVTDSNKTSRIDTRIQDFVTDIINDAAFAKTFVSRNYQLERTWILYSSISATSTDEIDSALILDEESKAWSTYKIAMNVLGHGQAGFDITLDQFPASPTSLNLYHLPIYLNSSNPAYDPGDDTLQSYHWEALDELFLGGDITGKLYELDTEQDDDGEPIEFSLKSAGWNPFKGQGIDCELGYIDVYIDVSAYTTFFVNFYKNDQRDFYKQTRVDSLPAIQQLSTVQDVQPLNPSTGGYRIRASGHGLITDDIIYMYQIVGPSFLNSLPWSVTVIDENEFEINEDFSSYGTSITSITQANPGIVTAPDHPFIDGDKIVISGGDMNEVIGNLYVVANATTSTFELQGVNTTGFTAYTTGGVVFPYYLNGGIISNQSLDSGKVWKRVYAGGTGYIHQVEIEQTENTKGFNLYGMIIWCKPTGSRMI